VNLIVFPLPWLVCAQECAEQEPGSAECCEPPSIYAYADAKRKGEQRNPDGAHFHFCVKRIVHRLPPSQSLAILSRRYLMYCALVRNALRFRSSSLKEYLCFLAMTSRQFLQLRHWQII
jgi:hypothetical protein